MLRKFINPAFKLRHPFISRSIYIPCQRLQKNPSSSRWIQRQINDAYVKYAARDGYRCRSAYKLIELDDKFHFLEPGKVVIDCGASPGRYRNPGEKKLIIECDLYRATVKQRNDSLGNETWSEMGKHSAQGSIATNKGLVIGVDLLDIREIQGAVLLGGHDFTSQETQDKVLSLLPSSGAAVILSDMAPNSSGNHSLDHEAILELTETVFDFATKTLADKGTFLCKLWDGRGTEDLIRMLRNNFKAVKKCKPRASRKESSEVYIYADGFSRPTPPEFDHLSQAEL